MNQQIRSWELHLKTNWRLEEIAAYCNPVIRGWFNYYGSYYRSELDDVVRQMDLRLGKWVERKYKKYKSHSGRAIRWVRGVRKREPKLFAHWQLYPGTAGL